MYVDFFSKNGHNCPIMNANRHTPIKRTRAHFVLFDKDLPFRHKVVKSKKSYKRQEKHRARPTV